MRDTYSYGILLKIWHLQLFINIHGNTLLVFLLPQPMNFQHHTKLISFPLDSVNTISLPCGI